ncbi:hypothetical protein V5E97_01645 [Singulisphaera sp. Ch08]|uniref:Uncharacterized protein n=1 Tax=Singulisphaera sp. Ch08 TaxID=3120278 RepID=A0AAU7CI81_9BACT
MAEPQVIREIDHDINQTVNIDVYLYPTSPGSLTLKGSCKVQNPAPPGEPPYPLTFNVHMDVPSGAKDPQFQLTSSGYAFEHIQWVPLPKQLAACPLAGELTTQVHPWPVDQPIYVDVIFQPDLTP